MDKIKLNTTNPEHLTYDHPELAIAVLGGIKLEGLDRLRATLKIKVQDVEVETPSLRHNLDLYNDIQTEKLIRKIAERLEVGTSAAWEALSNLTEALETYRLQELERQTTEQDRTKKLLSPEEVKQAQTALKTPNLMNRTSEYLQQTGIIGEELNALILWIVMTSRKCNDPLSAISLAKSGMGKSYLQERVAMCIPEEDILESTQMTESSFYRFGREELRNKVFLIEDLDGAESVLYPIREMQSKKRISKTVAVKDKNGKIKTVILVVEGPVSVCGCTTRERVYEDNANRSILLYLDSSKAQDQRIMDYHKKIKAGIVDQDKEHAQRELLQNMQRVLLPIKIVNPYSLQIALPESVMNPRRTLPLLLSFIEAITYYHQYQREKQYDTQTGEEFIATTPEDIEWSFKLLKEVLCSKSDELSNACRKFYSWLQTWTKNEGVNKFHARDIREAKKIHPRTLTRYLDELCTFGRLEITGGKKQRVGYEYELTTWYNDEQLQATLDEWMETTLQEITKTVKKAKAKASKTSKRASGSK